MLDIHCGIGHWFPAEHRNTTTELHAARVRLVARVRLALNIKLTRQHAFKTTLLKALD